jgi:hypothetical protein
MDDVVQLMLLLIARLRQKLQQLALYTRGSRGSKNSSFRRYLLVLRLRLRRRMLLVKRQLMLRLRSLQLQLVTAQKQFIASYKAYRARLIAPAPCPQMPRLPNFAVIHIRINFCWRLGCSMSIWYMSKRPDS